jgi:ABC-type Fe3+-hydroxamate transport system substrate-binding protein
MRPILALAFWCCALVLDSCGHANTGGIKPPGSNGALRIVTLVPSFADDVYAVGAGRQLVAVSAYTDDPRAKALPRVADASGIDVEAILALRPSVAIGIPAQARFTDALRRVGVRVVLLPDDAYERIFANIEAIGALTGHRQQARAEVARLRRETAHLQVRTRSYVRRPSVFVVLGSGPIWTAGANSFISTLIALAGGTNAAADLRAPYGQYSAEALLRHQPDVLVADPAIRLTSVLDRAPWSSLRAVAQHHVYSFDPDVFERPSPAYNDGVRWLTDRLAPLATAP